MLSLNLHRVTRNGYFKIFYFFHRHLRENKEKFILFISLTIAVGLSIFLAMFLWNMYRTNRLDRIAKSLRQPNLSQSTLCSVSGASSSNGGLTQHQQPQPRSASIDNGTISAFDTTSRSPAHSPNCPPGAIDIEVEVGDHEVDSMFRDPGPRPLILARATPPLQVRFLDR